MSAKLQPLGPPSSAGARWELDAIVSELRAVRDRALASRQQAADRPPRLPSRQALAHVVDGLSTVLFPNRLGNAELTDETVDYFVGHTLETTLRRLLEQVNRELRYASGKDESDKADQERAIAIVRAFAARLPEVRRLLDSDIRAAYEGDPAAASADEVLVCYPGVTAVIHHRLAHALHGLGLPLIARIVAEIAHSATGIDIHPGATIGASFFIDHGTGVVIGETAVIGQRVRLYQAVTLGAKRFPAHDDGALVKGGARHPLVEDDVVIYAGATILGRVTIGRGSIIGGNVWLTRSVPPGSNISQAQVRSEAFDGGAGI